MKKMTYYVAIYPDENGHYMVTFPDFPDMAPDFGKNMEECILSGTRFLNDVIAWMSEERKPLPTPSSPEKIREDLASDFLCLVPVTVYPPAPTIRINITGKSDVFARIDDYAKLHNLTRSDLMIRSTLSFMAENA